MRNTAQERMRSAAPAVPSAPLPSLRGFHLPIDDYAAYEPQRHCCPEPKPGVLAFREMVLLAYPTTSSAGVSRSCGSGTPSEHKEGRAWDWRVCAERDTEIADHLLDWLLAPDDDGNDHAAARRWGVMYVIWNRRIWAAYAAN